MFSSSGRLGITVDELSEQLAGYFGTKDGVLVTSVNNDSAAAKAGLKAGDVITALDGGTVDSPADLPAQTQRLERATEFTLDIVRDKKPMTLKGKVEAPRARRRTVSYGLAGGFRPAVLGRRAHESRELSGHDGRCGQPAFSPLAFVPHFGGHHAHATA